MTVIGLRALNTINRDDEVVLAERSSTMVFEVTGRKMDGNGRQ